MTLDDLQRRVAQYNPRADTDLIAAAYRFSRDAHQGQHRESGEEYIEHPFAVAMVLADLELDDVTLAAALLHDVVEDTRATLEGVRAAFGAEVAHLVDGVTKLSRLEYRSREEEQAENLRKMFLAMAKDIRVLLIKLADRLHNMRTLKHLPEERQRSIAQESLDIFAPLAHRLGISRLQWEMEDLALRYLEPKRYYELVELVARKRAEREEYAAEVIAALKDKLGAAGITAEITGRPKHFYSIFRKMYVQGREFDEIYDLVAIRVIVDTVRDCYAVLGIVHSLWKPLPGRFKDYVAMPKSNMYQSLHTTVIGPRGEPFELQIRTWDMHRTAEHGIAAHWRYKEGTRGDVRFEQKLSWLRQVLEWQHDLKDAREFMESLKIDLFGDEVFVFTPKGDVVDLPAGAMPLDFAYHIHTDVGHRCVGAKVNGKIVPLDHKLVNGDIVEILTSKTGSPSWDWLNLVTTSSAKSKIRAWFKKERREENEARGRESLQRELKRQNLDAAELLKPDRLAEVLRRLNYVAEADLLAAIGYGGLTAQQVVSRLKDELRKEKKPDDIEHLVKTEKRLAPTSLGINVEGQSSMLVRFSRCCNPLPGDPIVGYITRGRGVSIHRADCPNLHHLAGEERRVSVSWDTARSACYSVAVEITGMDRPGLLADVLSVISDTRTNVLSVAARGDRNKRAAIELVLEIRNLDQLQYLTRRILKVRDVFAVQRVTETGRQRDAARS